MALLHPIGINPIWSLRGDRVATLGRPGGPRAAAWRSAGLRDGRGCACGVPLFCSSRYENGGRCSLSDAVPRPIRAFPHRSRSRVQSTMFLLCSFILEFLETQVFFTRSDPTGVGGYSLAAARWRSRVPPDPCALRHNACHGGRASGEGRAERRDR